MIIRKAKIEDSVAMSRLVKKTIVEINSPYYTKRQILAWKTMVCANGYKKRIKIGNRYFLVAESNDKVVGVGVFNQEKKMISGMYVAHNLVGRGIGRKIIVALEKKAKKLDIKKITLNSSLSADGFYKRLGYRRIRKNSTKFNGVEIPSVLMVKNI